MPCALWKTGCGRLPASIRRSPVDWPRWRCAIMACLQEDSIAAGLPVASVDIGTMLMAITRPEAGVEKAGQKRILVSRLREHGPDRIQRVRLSRRLLRRVHARRPRRITATKGVLLEAETCASLPVFGPFVNTARWNSSGDMRGRG